MSKKFFITGSSSNIGKKFIGMLPSDSEIYCPTKKELDMKNLKKLKQLKSKILSHDIFILLHSVIIPKKHISKNSVILDYACGSGNFFGTFEKLNDSKFSILVLYKPFNILPNFCSNNQIFFNACLVLILLVSPA